MHVNFPRLEYDRATDLWKSWGFEDHRKSSTLFDYACTRFAGPSDGGVRTEIDDVRKVAILTGSWVDPFGKSPAHRQTAFQISNELVNDCLRRVRGLQETIDQLREVCIASALEGP
jgi:hypothetical protein